MSKGLMRRETHAHSLNVHNTIQRALPLTLTCQAIWWRQSEAEGKASIYIGINNSTKILFKMSKQVLIFDKKKIQ